MYIYAYLYTCISVCVCLCACVHVCVFEWVCTRACARVCGCVCVCINICIHIYIYISTYLYIYIRIHVDNFMDVYTFSSINFERHASQQCDRETPWIGLRTFAQSRRQDTWRICRRQESHRDAAETVSSACLASFVWENVNGEGYNS